MSKQTILVIEDDARIQEFLRDAVLIPSGYDVLTASDGEEGLRRALHDRPDVILLDLMLPRLSGLTLMGMLQKQNCHVPTIVITAYSSEQEILKAFRLGAKDFLQKPFTVEDVWAAIEKALTEERLQQERENLTQALAQANRRLQQQVQNWVTLNDIAKAISQDASFTVKLLKLADNYFAALVAHERRIRRRPGRHLSADDVHHHGVGFARLCPRSSGSPGSAEAVRPADGG